MFSKNIKRGKKGSTGFYHGHSGFAGAVNVFGRARVCVASRCTRRSVPTSLGVVKVPAHSTRLPPCCDLSDVTHVGEVDAFTPHLLPHRVPHRSLYFTRRGLTVRDCTGGLPGEFSMPSLTGTIYCKPTHFFLGHDGADTPRGALAVRCECTRSVREKCFLTERRLR